MKNIKLSFTNDEEERVDVSFENNTDFNTFVDAEQFDEDPDIEDLLREEIENK